MGFAKPIEQYLFGNLLTKMHVFMYLKDIIRGDITMKEYQHLIGKIIIATAIIVAAIIIAGAIDRAGANIQSGLGRLVDALR